MSAAPRPPDLRPLPVRPFPPNRPSARPPDHKTIKKYILPAAAVLFLFLLLCCVSGRCRSRWYPVEGGYVNLARVSTVVASGRLVLVADVTTEKKDLLGRVRKETVAKEVAVLLDGRITAETVASAKEKLARAPKWKNAIGAAALKLDRFEVPFAPVPAKADAAALAALLDGWLAQARSIDRYVK